MRSPRGTKRRALQPTELAVELTLALVISLSAIILFATFWSPPAKDAGLQPTFIGSLSRAEASSYNRPAAGSNESALTNGPKVTQTMTITVTARGSQQNIIGGQEIEVEIPKGGTVAQLTNRLTDRYPVLQPFAMVALNGGMLPQSLELSDGQTVELMAPHSAGLTFLGKPLPTSEP